MKLQDLFKKDISRNIDGVVYVEKTDEELISHELEEYVVTDELNKHFRSFFEALSEEEKGKHGNIGVWISGFFGSGKSHFLKMLGYLLSERSIKGKRPCEYFVDKFNGPDIYSSLTEYTNNHNIDVILFDIDSKAATGTRYISEICMKSFFQYLGFESDSPWLAYQEWELWNNGKYEEFKEAYEKIAGKSWEKGRRIINVKGQDAVKALLQVSPGTSEEEAKNYFDQALQSSEYKKKVSPEFFRKMIGEYLGKKGDKHRIFFLIDEVGQYIGGSSDLILNLQTVTEELTSLKGKAWIVVTSQEAIDQVTHLKGQNENDFSKIRGRFATTLNLSSSNADEVIRKRLLDKRDEVKDELAKKYDQYHQELLNTIEFSDTSAFSTSSYTTKDQFIDLYPLLPYQSFLTTYALELVGKRGQAGSNLSRGERSLLSIFQKAIIKRKEDEVGSLLPFDVVYDAISQMVESYITNIISTAENNTNINELGVRILKILFLLKGSDDKFKLTAEHIAVLLVDSMDVNIRDLRAKVIDSLETLQKCGFISKRANDYEFLSDEEKAIEREIDRYEVSEQQVLEFVYNHFFEGCINYNKYQYDKTHMYEFSRKVNSYEKTRDNNSSLGLHIYTPAYYQSLQSGQVLNGTNGGIIVLNIKDDEENSQENPLWCIEQYLKIETFLKRSTDNSRQVAARKEVKIMEADELYNKAKTLLDEAAREGKFYMGSTPQNFHKENIKDIATELLRVQFENIYNFFDHLPKNRDDVKTVIKLSNQGTLVGDELPKSHIDVLNYITREHGFKVEITLEKLYEEFRTPGYGWNSDDIDSIIAKLWISKLIIIKYEGKEISYDNSDLIVNYLGSRDDKKRLKISPKEEVNVADTNEIIDIFHEIKIENSKLSEALNSKDADEIKIQIGEWQKQRINEVEKLLVHYESKKYPGKQDLEDYKEILNDLIKVTIQSTSELFKKLIDNKDDFIEKSKKFEVVRSFLTGSQREIYDNGLSMQKRIIELGSVTLPESVKESLNRIAQIVNDSYPYAVIPELTGKVNELTKFYNDFVSKEVVKTLENAQKIAKELGETYQKALGPVWETIQKNIEAKQKEIESLNKYEDVIVQRTQLPSWQSRLTEECENEVAKIEAEKKNAENPGGTGPVEPVAPVKKTKNISLRSVVSKTRITSDEDIDKIAEEIKERLKKEIDDGSIVILG